MAAPGVSAEAGDLSGPFGGSASVIILGTSNSNKTWNVELERVRKIAQALFHLSENPVFQGRVIKFVGFEDRSIDVLVEYFQGKECSPRWYNENPFQADQAKGEDWAAKSIIQGYAHAYSLALRCSAYELVSQIDKAFSDWFMTEPQTISTVKKVLDYTDNNRYKSSDGMKKLLIARTAEMLKQYTPRDTEVWNAIGRDHAGFSAEVLQLTQRPIQPALQR